MTKQENLPQSLWNMYGLKHNPFSTDPLLIYDGFIPLETFVGREQELRKIKTLFKTGGGTRIIVTGNTGVGKTTLVNYSRWEAITNNNFFTHIREIEVKDGWNCNDFISHTLANLYNAITRIELEDFSEDLKKKLSYLFDIMELNEFGFSANVLGSGVGFNSSKKINKPRITTELLKNLFKDVINELVRIGYSQIVLHYNNLENLDREKTIRLFVGLRDFLQNERVHFVFVGGEPFPSSIYQEDKVSSIFMYSPIELNVFTLAEITQILEKRINCLAIKNMKTLKPYKEEVLRELNKIHKGNIRDILNSLCVAMIEILSESPNEPIILTKNKLREVLKKALKDRYLSRMSPTDIQVLNYILKVGETTNKELSNKLGKKKQNISKNIKKLKRLRAIKEKKIGVEKIIVVTSEMKWLNLEEQKIKKEETEKNIEKSVQKFLEEF